MENFYTKQPQYYGDYLGLEQILSAQRPESEARGVDAHDEMLFIIIHQAYELWFKQIMHELNSVLAIFNNETINDNSAALQTVTHRLGRIVEIWKVLIEQVRILETMRPIDFLDFRDLLTPASGFQSYQFRILETKLGLKMEQRHQQHYYKQQLREEHLQQLENQEVEQSLFELLDKWLSRLPFWDVATYWSEWNENVENNVNFEQPFWQKYREIYKNSLRGAELTEISLADFDDLFFNNTETRSSRLSAAACRSAMFITIYRELPLLQQPFELLNRLLEIDELMATWRYRHWIMVRRMIGLRAGTGGSTGAGYLKGAVENHHIFKDLSRLATYLMPRTVIPKLPKKLETQLIFNNL